MVRLSKKMGHRARRIFYGQQNGGQHFSRSTKKGGKSGYFLKHEELKMVVFARWGDHEVSIYAVLCSSNTLDVFEKKKFMSFGSFLVDIATFDFFDFSGFSQNFDFFGKNQPKTAFFAVM